MAFNAVTDDPGLREAHRIAQETGYAAPPSPIWEHRMKALSEFAVGGGVTYASYEILHTEAPGALSTIFGYGALVLGFAILGYATETAGEYTPPRRT